MRTTDLDVLRRTDPATGIPDGLLTEHELDGLRRIKTRIAAAEHLTASATEAPAKPTAAGWRGTPRRTVLVGAAAAVVAGAGLVVADPFGADTPAIAATPPLLKAELTAGKPAKAELLRLAARAARDTSLPGDSGSLHAVHLRSWALSTSVDAKERVTSVILPRDIGLEWHADGSGQMRTTAAAPFFVNGESRKAWEKEGRPGKRPGELLYTQTWPVGGFQPTYHYPLPTDPSQLLAELKQSQPSKYTGAEMVVAIGGLYRETMPEPAVRSAVLSLLARRSDVVALGAMTDRAGRAGRAFAVDTDAGGLPNRRVLIVDPATGALLAQEEVLTKTPGRLAVRVPCVTSYMLYLKVH